MIMSLGVVPIAVLNAVCLFLCYDVREGAEEGYGCVGALFLGGRWEVQVQSL